MSPLTYCFKFIKATLLLAGLIALLTGSPPVAAQGGLPIEAVWSSTESDYSTSVSWGDYDNDGDLDLAVANLGGKNRVYRNDNGILRGQAVWTSPESDFSGDITWGDYDGDGDLDLAVANGVSDDEQPNRVYRNEGLTNNGQTPIFTLAWSSPEADISNSVAWGDYDKDGDLDLAVANGEFTLNRVYRNDGSTFTLVWPDETDNIPDEADSTSSMVWGDYDDDGDLDLAVSNNQLIEGQFNRVYRNDGVNNDEPNFSLVWTSNEKDDSASVVWGDYDGDDKLDLLVANFDKPNRIYRYKGGGTPFELIWSSSESDLSLDIDWGDYNGDGTLDIAVANLGQPQRLYRLDSVAGNNTPTYTLAWSSAESENTQDIAWGDLDNDGDLDLAIGNGNLSTGQINRVYRNDVELFDTQANWSSPEGDLNQKPAWGDYNSDGLLDLIIADNDGFDPLYRNDGFDTATQTPALTFVDFVGETGTPLSTIGSAWGDYDGDGDLDLAAVGGPLFGQNHRIYRNDNGALNSTPVWLSEEEEWGFSLAWGDYDNDSDLDLAIGNFLNNQVYRNDGLGPDNNPIFSLAWTSTATDITRDVAWGDYDGDGDLDLAVGNGATNFSGTPADEPNHIYRNNGLAGDGQTPLMSLAWTADEATDHTIDVAWGDVDNDGDLDLAVASADDWPSRVYLNNRRNHAPLVNNPPYAFIPRPGPTADADFFSTPHINEGATLSIDYILYDPDGDDVPRILPEYSPVGGGQWRPATPGPGGDGVTDLAASPGGTAHTFVWNVEADLIKNDNVRFRLRVLPDYDRSPIRWGAGGSNSPLFRVAVPWYIKVVDAGGNPISGASIYAAGEAVPQVNGATVTDPAGLFNPGPLAEETALVAFHQIGEQPTTRAAHDGWAYRTYLTNLDLSADGVPHPFRVTDTSGEQRLVVREETPLVLFNIVASVEWDATDDYLTMLEDAFNKASAYLYDVTDGQMAFSQVTIYDKGQNWAGADFQFSTKNTVRPYAFVGGIISDDEAHTIRVGRFWDGGSGNQGDWNEPKGYRTLIHEFGHYALFLEDAYFMRQVDENGNFTGQVDAFCTEESVADEGNGSDNTNATMMFYQYNATELSDKNHNWSDNCEFTEQYRLNAQADWETIVEHYPQLKTPTARGGLMAGPSDFPGHLLPFPTLTVNNSGKTGAASIQLTVRGPQGRAVPNTLVALYTIVDQMTVAIDQGLTDQQGRIDIYGASEGDTLRAATIDGSLAGAVGIGSDSSYQLELVSTGAGSLLAQAGSAPHLNLIPGTDGDSLTLRVVEAPASSLPLDAVVIPNEGAGTPQSTSLAYAPGDGTYSGNVSFAGVGLGTGRVRVSGDALPSAINSDYNLQETRVATATHLYAEDGNFELKIPADSLPVDGYATVVPTGYVPGPLPAGVAVIGSAYEVRVSGSLTSLQKDGLVRLHYHPQVMGEHTDIAIYFWDTNAWQPLGGEPNEVDNAWSVPSKRLGIYALLGEPVEFPYGVYLPLIVK